MTSETRVQHTPGPWLRDGTTVYALVPGPEDGRLINRWHATVQRDNGERGQCSPGEAEAVALVMQAAPDLLAALEEIAPQYMAFIDQCARTVPDNERDAYFRQHNAALERAFAAIRRARGEE